MKIEISFCRTAGMESMRIKMKKYMFLIIIATVCILIAGCFGINAYLTDGDKADNELVVGSNYIEIVEEFEPPSELVPGMEIKKNVKVENTGLSDCYVRIKAVFDNNHMEQYCEIDWNDNNWIYSSTDGYWYYPNAIANDESTPSLMTTVKIKDDAPEYAMKDFDIIIYAESIESRQAEGFDDYEQAWANYQKNKSN